MLYFPDHWQRENVVTGELGHIVLSVKSGLSRPENLFLKLAERVSDRALVSY